MCVILAPALVIGGAAHLIVAGIFDGWRLTGKFLRREVW